MFLCRVLVGQYCKGRTDAKAPDVLNAATHQLYDSTVDSEQNPGIFVTYHDAQVRPLHPDSLARLLDVTPLRRQLRCTNWVLADVSVICAPVPLAMLYWATFLSATPHRCIPTISSNSRRVERARSEGSRLSYILWANNLAHFSDLDYYINNSRRGFGCGRIKKTKRPIAGSFFKSR